MPKRSDPQDFELVTLSCRAFGRHAKIVHAAAAAKNLSVNSYMRKIIIDWAHADLGLDAPDYTALTASPTQIAEAARLRGVSVQEFTAHAVRELLARTLEQSQPKTIGTIPRQPAPVLDQVPPHRLTESGTRRRAG